MRIDLRANFWTAISLAWAKRRRLKSALSLRLVPFDPAVAKGPAKGESQQVLGVSPFGSSSRCPYGIGIVGSGARPHIAAGHGGSGGVGIRKSFPWVAAVPPVMHMPVKVPISGYGVVNPSVNVWRNATIWFSSVSVKPSIPTVMSSLFFTSAIGQQSTFSVVPAGQCPEVIVGKGKASLVL